VEQLETALGLEHGTSIAYAAWTNGACERAGRAALRLLRAVVSERRLPTELWHTAVPVVEHALNSSPRPLLKGCSPLEVWSGRPVRRALDIVVSQGDGGLELVPLDHGELARLTADTLTDVRDEIRTGVVEVSRRLEQHARDKANAHRPRQLRLIERATRTGPGGEYSTGLTAVESAYGDIADWDTSKVTTMRELLYNKATCNPEIGNWNTSAVTTMQSMFQGASAFNANIGNWDTAAVSTIYMAFASASAFNQDIGRSNTSAVGGMYQISTRGAC
jgi:surface protein